MRKQISNLLIGTAYATDCMLAALSAIAAPIMGGSSKSDPETRLEELYARHEAAILNSALPDATKQNLLVSLHAPHNLEGVKAALASDFQMLGDDMEVAVKQYIDNVPRT